MPRRVGPVAIVASLTLVLSCGRWPANLAAGVPTPTNQVSPPTIVSPSPAPSPFAPPAPMPTLNVPSALTPPPAPVLPPAAAPAPQCSVVFNSFTAQSQAAGSNKVLLTWSASVPCGQASGSIGGSYFAGGSQAWVDYVHSASGTYLDAVPKIPGNTAFCTVNVSYVMYMGGTKVPRQASATAYIC